MMQKFTLCRVAEYIKIFHSVALFIYYWLLAAGMAGMAGWHG